MLLALGKKVLIVTQKESFLVVVGVEDVTRKASKVGLEIFSNVEDSLASRILVGSRRRS